MSDNQQDQNFSNNNILSLLDNSERYELLFEDGSLLVSKKLIDDNCELLKARTSGSFKDKSDSTIDLKQFPKQYFAYLFNYLISDIIPTDFVCFLKFVNIASYLCVTNFREKIGRRIPMVTYDDLSITVEDHLDLFLNDHVFSIFITELISYFPTFCATFDITLRNYIRGINIRGIAEALENINVLTLYMKGSCIGHDNYCCIHKQNSNNNIAKVIKPNSHKYCYNTSCDEKKTIEEKNPINDLMENMNPMLGGSGLITIKQTAIDNSRCCSHIYEIEELSKLLKFADFVKKILKGTVYRA